MTATLTQVLLETGPDGRARFREQAGAAMANLPRLVEACEREAARGDS